MSVRTTAACHVVRHVLLAGLLAMSALPGCSTRAWYDSLQFAAQQACERQPASERERCESRRNTQDFDAYNAQRARHVP
jgi:hypothetical protein